MRTVLRSLLVLVFAVSLSLSGPRAVTATPASPAAANGVVGDGTAASCTYTELVTEMGSPGYITFACGPAPLTIILEFGGGVQPLGNSSTILDGGGLITLSAANFNDRRLFDIYPNTSLTLTHMTLTNATTVSFAGGALRNRGRLVLDHVIVEHVGAQGAYGGGAVDNLGFLLIRDSTLRLNYSAGGGAILNEAGAQAQIENSVLVSNTVGSGSYGGAILNSGSLTITGSLFVGNHLAVTSCPIESAAICGGGALANLTGATLVVSTTTFSRNSTNEIGGAILNRGNLSLADSTLSNNSGRSGGGAVGNLPNANAVLNRVVLRDNQSSDGGGMYNGNGSLATLTDVTIAGNSADDFGGGFYNYNATAQLSNTTLFGNSTAGFAGGIQNRADSTLVLTHVTISGNTAATAGGGLWNDKSSATLTHVTVAGNTAGGGPNAGGIANLVDASAHLYLKDVLLVGNTPVNCFGQPPDTATYNLTTDGTCFTALNGNQTGTPQVLGPLANNGGVTLTRLPAPGSPAVNNGQCIGGLTTDQRGLPRLVGVGCDIGAVERQANDFGWYLFLAQALR
jgi:hypothetical protein